MAKKSDFGSIGVPLSCSIFLEWALNSYKPYIKSINEDTLKIVHEWNTVLTATLKNSKYKSNLGATGDKLLHYTTENINFGSKCIATAQDVNVQSLHYALRFDKSVGFLRDKYEQAPKLRFCDLGAGFSPLSVVFQTQYGIENVYCIDIVPEIADIYTQSAYKLYGNAPDFIDWKTLQTKPEKTNLNTIISVGCFPHMPIETQKEYMREINDKFDNFFLEIKYKKQNQTTNIDNAFSLSDLQELCLDFENIMDVETAVKRNAIDYLRKFMHAKPNRADFINNCRSLFLSR